MSLQEDAKKLLPLVQALADGKEVQYKNLSHRYNPIGSLLDLFLYRNGGYHPVVDESVRIKPEPKWRPYTREEWELVDKVRCKSNECVYAVGAVYLQRVSIIHCGSNSFDDMLHHFTNLDGSPCGVEVEE